MVIVNESTCQCIPVASKHLSKGIFHRSPKSLAHITFKLTLTLHLTLLLLLRLLLFSNLLLGKVFFTIPLNLKMRMHMCIYQRGSHALMNGQDPSPWAAHRLRLQEPISCAAFPVYVLDAEERTLRPRPQSVFILMCDLKP